MKRLGEWKKEDGVTLFELLAVLAISGIVLSTVYGVFITGINLYKKIGIESQLKEEADYILANVLNELYSFSPDDVIYIPERSELTLIKKNELVVDSKDFVTTTEKENTKVQKAILQLVDNPSLDGKRLLLTTHSLFEDEIVERSAQINSEKYHIRPVKDDTGTELPIIDFQCTNREKSSCKGGIVTFHFILSHDLYSDQSNRLYVEPIEFYSKFGY
ncbi:prepilin-type N-terminal cleavage/methylation domain-containing protein [Sutcliffiella horikoshii]|uniref:type II secretion system protein n=1 Tax=Sutcliffiella horikoshii TaxID=79883 RepID=UPI0007D07291|nr:prepilin-type N-terminal cleavage/methylation domain-containing protein [Sutcliffiella horikoshii]MCM3619323.1 prepilin-type N-terminal cleavage/methylation domain-containing protein [Sutcliffiella horikoshii]